MIVAFVLFLERVHAVHQPHGAGVFRVRKHIFYPGVAGAANVDEHIRLVYRARVGRRGFIAVRVHAGTDEQRQPIFSAGYLPRQIVTGKIRGDNAYFRLFRSGRATAQGQAERQQKQNQFAHGIYHSNLNFKFNFIVYSYFLFCQVMIFVCAQKAPRGGVCLGAQD